MSYDALEELVKDCSMLVQCRALELDSLLRKLGLDIAVVRKNGKMCYGHGDDRHICLLVPTKSTLKLGLLEDDDSMSSIGEKNPKGKYSFMVIDVDVQLPIPALRSRIAQAKKAYHEGVTRYLRHHANELMNLSMVVWPANDHKPERGLTDEQYLQSMNTKHILGEVFLGVLRHVPVEEAKDEEHFNRALQKALGFQRQADCKLLRSAIDLLEDTQGAIDEVKERGLYVSTRPFTQQRESYLRLYGVLNAVYLQARSIKELMRMFGYSKCGQYWDALRNHPLFKARNAIGAHALDNQEDLHNRATVTHNRLTQSSLSKWGKSLTVISDRSGVIDVNLMEEIETYEQLSTGILLELAETVVRNRFTKNTEDKEWLNLRLRHVRRRVGKTITS